MTHNNEAASNRGLVLYCALACATSAALVAVWAALIAFNLVGPTYALQLSVIAQGPTKQASLQASRRAQRTLEHWAAAASHRAADVSQLPAIASDGKQTRNWLTIAHYTITSRAIAHLDRIEDLIKSRSPWHVTDISRSGQFVRVPVRPGVTTLRLAQTVGTADAATHVRLQTSGPSVTFSAADAVPICLVVFLVLSFAATEHNKNDVYALPPGMHPAVVFAQALTLALFACLLMSYARTGISASGAGLLVLDGAVALAVSRWLWITKSHWSGRRLMYARLGFAVSAALLCIAGVLMAVLR